MSTDVTKDWIRNPSDEKAVANGCAFDVERGAYTVWWIERYCRLYEGEQAGEPLVLHGCHQCESDHPFFPEWNKEAIAYALKRAAKHCECVAAGHAVDWQYECLMRLFGWVRWSTKWDRFVRRFRRASIWVAKKNKKSPTLAAVGLYLLCGDGEPGQKVFLAAKDGLQAKDIAGKHAFEMLDQSAELTAECEKNKTTSQITHLATRSILKPLSSSNSRTQQSKEGLNGSILVDETHVVDREFMSRISRAGISRSEPMQAEFSTAGNNPDGYGKQQFDYATDVVEGGRTDEGLFVAIYAAPQDLSDDDLQADPLRYAHMANPAMGHTVEADEFMRDYELSSGGSIEQFNEFKMYRLNIWQAFSNPYIRETWWKRGQVTYGLEELRGRRCFAALDLALRWDVSAFVRLFEWDDDPEGNTTYRLWPQFFLPRTSAEKTRVLVPWFDWERRGDLVITDGNVTDFPRIRKEINEAFDEFGIAAMAYDDRYAESFCQALQDEDGRNVVQFNQTLVNFSEPLQLFQSLLSSGRMQHPNNECFNWQSRNAQKGRNGMLQKPEEDSHRKIDGIVASVMALGMAIAAPPGYDESTPPMFFMKI